MDILLIDPRTDLRYDGEKELRYRVLREPLGRGRHEVGFVGEQDALHLLATEGPDVIGCVLFDFISGRLRAMAVAPSSQRRGVGERLVRRLESEVLVRGVRQVTLHAREPAVPFYAKLGYIVRGEPFTEVGIVHREMWRAL